MASGGLLLPASAADAVAAASPPAAPAAKATKAAPAASGGQHAADPTAAARAKASNSAKATGKPVTVDALTDQTSQTVANPDGSFTWTGSVAPVRVKRNGAWTKVDATLRPNADGTLSPTAVPGGLAFGSGGSTTLARMTDVAGHTLTYTWPAPLPTPQVSGSTAVYRSVFPGVDLSVTAGETGAFEDTLVVHDAAAAADPALATLKLGMTASAGLTVSSDNAGNTKVTDTKGSTVFAFGAPLAWDSAAPTHGAAAATAPTPPQGAASDSHHPGLGAHRALLKTAVSHGSVSLSADLAALGSDPTFPVFLDPVTVPNNGEYGWDEVQQAYPNVSNYNNTSVEDLGVGYQGFSCPCGTERAYYGLNLPSAAVWADYISSATLYTSQDYAANTSASTGIYLESSAPIGSGTTWNAQPGFNWVATSTDPAGASNGVSFDFSGFANNTIRANHWSSWTFMLYSANDGSSTYFKRFKYNPTISLTYDNEPYVNGYTTSPTPFNTIGGTGSCPYADGGWLSHNSGTGFQPRVTVNSSSNPQNTLGVNFWLYDNTTSGWYWNKAAQGGYSSGTAVYGPVANQLSEGHKYTWWADAYDLTLENTGETNTQCSFTVDTTPPSSLSVGSTDFPASGSSTPATKQVNQPGNFTLSAYDATSGVWCFEYAVDNILPTAGQAQCNTPNSVQVANPAAGNASATLSNISAPTWGTHTLTVDAVDRAGNRSQPVNYQFYVLDNPNVAAVLGNVTGDGIPDLLAVDTNGNLLSYSGNHDLGAAPTQLSSAANGPYNGTWANTVLAHRGTVTTGNKVDDLFAWTPTNPTQLYQYRNPGNGQFVSSQAGPVSRPSCTTADCTTYHYKSDWSQLNQLVSLGPVTGVGQTGKTVLATVEPDGNGGGVVWAFSSRIGGFSTPVRVSSDAAMAAAIPGFSWTNADLVSPGDVNGDGLPDLWVRDRNTGTVWLLPNTTTGGVLSFGAPTQAGATGGLPASVYRQLTSDGAQNLTGTAAYPDLVATSLYGNTLIDIPGTSGTGSAYFGAGQTITPVNWSGTVTSIEGSLPVPSVGPIVNQTLAGSKCVDDRSGGLSNGTAIQLYACNNTWPQSFILQANGTITSNSNPGMCLDIVSVNGNGSGTANGTSVQLYGCNGWLNQAWQLQSDGNGHSRIYNPNSGRCLDDPNATTSDGTQLQIWDCNGSAAQTWGVPVANMAKTPISLWRADDMANPTADTMGNHNLALNGTVNFDSGVTGQATDHSLGFTGTGSYGDAGTNLVNTTQSYTLSAWVKLTNASGWQDIITQDGANVSGVYLQYDGPDNRWALSTLPTDSTSATTTRALSPAAPTTGAWTMVTGVYDATAGVMKLYVNGAFVSNVWPAPATFSAGGHTAIGRGFWSGNVDWFVGDIDNARVYNSALTDAQVASLYATKS